MIAKRAGQLIAFGFAITMILSILLHHQKNDENGLLLLTINTLFTGILPIIISILAGRAFLNINKNEAFFICCGMLLFGFGSIVTGIWGFFPVSKNQPAAFYHSCVLVSSLCQIHAALMLTSTKFLRAKKRRLLLTLSLLCSLLIALIIAISKQITPIFWNEHGFATMKTVMLWISVVLYFYACLMFYQRYQEQKEAFHVWYALALFMVALGILGGFTAETGTLQRWCGSLAQCIGVILAYYSIVQISHAAHSPSKSEKTEQYAFKDKTALISTIFEKLTEPLYLKNREGIFIAGNAALSSAIGAPLDSIIGKSDLELFYDCAQAKQIMDYDRSVISSGRAQAFEERMPTPIGDRFFLSSKTPWLDDAGNVIGIIGVLQDITERKEMEIKIKQQSEALKEKNQLITEFFVNISHDFKTPLTILMLCIDLLEDDACNQKNIAVMKQNCHRLGRLISNLLDLAKIDAGHFTPNWECFDLIQQMRCLADSVSQYAEKKHLTITFHFSHEARYICSDSFMTERIIINLLSNAIKYTNPGGLICVSCHISSQKIQFSVKDTGLGIPDHKKNHIFNRYAQVTGAPDRSTQESGIGLALTKSLVELLDGKIWFESQEGIGSEFFVELPVLHFSQQLLTVECTGLQDNKRIQMELSD